jgi:orotate phosphoribosyltransferase
VSAACGTIGPRGGVPLAGRQTLDRLKQDFIEFALASGVLRFGEFRTKAGRLSPYFFNAGLFNRGGLLARLADFYAETLLAARAAGRIEFDMLFGPAYKGITLAAATAMALAARGVDVPFSFNRKEAKDHGEGGVIIGAPLAGRVVIVDDVISAGTSVGESVGLIRAAAAEPAGVLIALDRMERAGPDDALSAQSAVQMVEHAYGMPVLAIASLSDLLQFLNSDAPQAANARSFAAEVTRYRAQYGV